MSGMSMDLPFVEAVVCELRSLLVGAVVNKVYQPSSRDVVLRFWTGRETLQLLISVAPHASRLHLVTARLPNPPVPPRFCQLLRAHLARLLSVERIVGERIVRFEFTGLDGAGHWYLVAELLGPRANLLLLDNDGNLVDSLLRSAAAPRGLVHGYPYSPPPPLLRHDLEEGLPPLPQTGGSLRDWLLATITPMTPLLASDIAAGVSSGLEAGELLATLHRQWCSRDFKPILGIFAQQPVLSAFSPWFLKLDSLQSFASPSVAAEAFYAEEVQDELFTGGRQELTRCVARQLARLDRRMQQIESEVRQATDCERLREFGDLLLTNLRRMQRGMSSLDVPDWFADPPHPVTIPLDPMLTPQENAERFFVRYRKAKRGLEHMTRRREETRIEREWLEGMKLALDEAREPEELVALRTELVAAGLLPAARGPQRRLPGAVPLRRAVSPGGYHLVWGKSNRGNDEVSRRLAAPDDLWFHARGIPGCHLILRREGSKGAVPDADQLYAAELAAGYSRGRYDAKVEVMVAEARSVRPLPGGPPGLVTVERHFSMLVVPRRLDESDAG